ncbi:MAG: CDP-glucose 4,6-dehydratase [Sedimentisphaerales bacterium]|nr:CDP-glucose 4,6-dehydratase [Sedimentisphaerales bacterium]
MFNNFYKNKRVLVTGHTGFKGSWLCQWLLQLGADVCGVALEPETKPNHFELLKLESKIGHNICDIRDAEKLIDIFNKFEPEIVFHLAAQALVRRSYDEPEATFGTNVMGTVNVLEAVRKSRTVKAAVIISSDKCYKNLERSKPYCEDDPMGGHDPYSASKGCTELVVDSYRKSFFAVANFGKTHNTLIASARAGNVIGGGDWSEDRLMPDIVKAASGGKPVVIRNPESVRPWQHVLEPSSAYLLLGSRLGSGDTNAAQAWNFGPDDGRGLLVKEIVREAKVHWPQVDVKIEQDPDQPHEAKLLKLDCRKAKENLKWYSTWPVVRAIERTVKWYLTYYESSKILTESDIDGFVADAKTKNLTWAQ